MSKKKTTRPVPPADEQVEQMMTEIRLIGFAVAKEIVHLRGLLPRGEMPCPLCGQKLRYSIAASNQHMVAKCERQGCISARE